jgi:transcriptional regulator with XRE-family HTH domain
MKKKGFTRKSLAESLGVTKGRISQYLGGERNLTLRTLADIFTAMDSMVVVGAAGLSIEKIVRQGEEQPTKKGATRTT